MWTTLLLCCLVALSASEQHDGAWKQDTEYHYNVHTQTLAAIPNLKNQWVGLFTKADLTIRPISKDVLVGKLQNGKYSEWHDSLPNGPTGYQPDNELSYEPMQLNTQPFGIRLNKGAIESIAVNKDMTNVELNQLKSILSQLQVDIQAKNGIQSPHSHLPLNNYQEDNGNQALYKVMESTVTGKCDTFYDVSRIPMYLAQTYTESNTNAPMKEGESFYELYKTKNYSACEQRVGYHFGVDGLTDFDPQSNVMASLTKSAVSRVILTGSFDKYTIRSSVTTNRVVKVHPEKETQHDSVIVSQVNLTLASMEHTTSKPQVQFDQLVDVGDLVYSYNTPSNSKNGLRHDHEEIAKIRASQNAYKANDADDVDEVDDDNFDGQENQPWKSRERRSAPNQIARNNRNQWGMSYDDEQEDEESTGKLNGKPTGKPDYYQPKPTLSYAPENPLLSHFVGNNGRSIQHKDNFSARTEVQKLAREIAEDLDNANEMPVKHTLRKFAVLTKIISTMDAQQIAETSSYINQAQRSVENADMDKNKSRKVYRDALLSAGTGPAIVELMKWIEEGQIQDGEAAEVIAAFPKTIREPTEEMQQRFFEFVKHENIRKQSNVNTTAGIAFTRFLYQAQVNQKIAVKYYPVETYGPLSERNSQFVSQKVVPYFARLLETSVEQKDIPNTLYAIRALGNLGHTDLATIFEPYLNGKVRVSDFQRLAIVLALDKYTINYPRLGAVMTYKMYQNKAETPEIRSAAVFQLLRTNPQHVVFERMAEETNNEENIDVRTAVRSALESVARLTNPENAKFAESAKRALSLLKPEKQGVQYARTHLRDYAIREMEASYEQQSSYIVNKDSFIPNGIFVDTVGNLGGFKRRAEFQAVVSSVEELLNTFYDNVQTPSEKTQEGNDYYSTNGQSRGQSYWSAEKIMNLLNMKPNKAQPLEGQFLYNVMNTERFFAFDKQAMEHLPNIAKKIANQLRNGMPVDYVKFYNQDNIVISFPLETGLPFTFNYRTPTAVQVTGQIRARTTPDVVSSEDNVRVPESLNLTAEIDAVYSVANEVTVSFINPATHQRYAAGYDKKVQVYAPFRVASDVDIVNREVKTVFQPLNTQQPTKVLQMGSWPFTARDDITKLRPVTESKHTRDIASQPIRDTEYTFGAEETGLVFMIQGKQQKYSNQIINALKAFGKHDMTSFALFGQQTTSPEHYSLNVVFDPIRSTTKSTKVTIKYDQDATMTGQGKHQTHPRARGQSADGTENLAVPESVRPNSEERRQQFLRNSVEGLNTPNGANVVDFAVEFIGQPQNYEYVATISRASSKTEGKSRILVFAQKATSKSNGQLKPIQTASKVFYFQADAKYYTPEDLRQPIREQIYANVDWKLSYGYDNVLEVATIRGNMQMKQSSDLRKYLQEQLTKYSQNEYIVPNTVDHIDITLDVKDSPNVSVWEQYLGVKINDIYNYLRYSTVMHLHENSEYNGKPNKVSFEIRLSNNLKAADMVLETQHTKAVWNGVAVPQMIKKFIVVPINWDLLSELKREVIQNRDTCFVSGNEIITFENRTVKSNNGLGDAWHLAVHKMRVQQQPQQQQLNGMRVSGKSQNDNGYTGAKHQASILIKDAQTNQGKGKEVLIVLHQSTEEDITLRLAPQKSSNEQVPRLIVDERDEKPVSFEQETEIHSTEKPRAVLARVFVVKGVHGSEHEHQRRNSLRVETTMGNLEVIYDGENVQIRSTGFNRLNRGVCGAFTGQAINALKTPVNTITNNHNDFVSSWAVLDQQSNRYLQSKVQHIQKTVDNYPREEIFYSSPIPDIRKGQKPNQQDNDNNLDNESNLNQHLKFGTKHQTQFVENLNEQEICFSQRPLPACPMGYKVNGSFVKNIPVVCRNINDKAAQLYKQQLQRGKDINMSHYNAEKMIKFSLPKRCEREH